MLARFKFVASGVLIAIICVFGRVLKECVEQQPIVDQTKFTLEQSIATVTSARNKV